MRRHLIRLASAPFISSRLATFGWVRFPCATREKHNAEFTNGGWEHWSYLSRLWTKVQEIFKWCRKPLVLSNALFNCVCHISFRRYSPLSLEVVENPSKCKSFWPPIFVGGTASTFLRQFVRATYYPLLGKVWLSSVCWSPSAKPGNEAECRIYGGWVKCRSSLSRLWTKVHDVLRRRRRPLVVVNALDRLSISCFIPKI